LYAEFSAVSVSIELTVCRRRKKSVLYYGAAKKMSTSAGFSAES
jgi:hypothetical protein